MSAILSEFILANFKGQLVTTGRVDRFIKSSITPAERKQKAMDWLARLQSQPA